MVAGVGDDRVARTEDRPERAEVGLVAGGEDDRVLGADPFGQLLLQLHVQIDRPVQKSRAREAGAVALERVACSLSDASVASQAQVVVGAEHDPPGALHLDDRQRRPLQHVEVGKGAELAGGPQLLQAFELTSFCENVDRGRHCARIV